MAENASSTSVLSLKFRLLEIMLPAFAASGLFFLAAYGMTQPERAISYQSYRMGEAR